MKTIIFLLFVMFAVVLMAFEFLLYKVRVLEIEIQKLKTSSKFKSMGQRFDEFMNTK